MIKIVGFIHFTDTNVKHVIVKVFLYPTCFRLEAICLRILFLRLFNILRIYRKSLRCRFE